MFKAWLAGLSDYFKNVGAAAKMTTGWFLGVGADSKIFFNDRVANELRNSPGIVKAREDYYATGKTTDFYNFGLKGLWNAGTSPILQFVGSYKYTISVIPESASLLYTITNTTSFSSFAYHITSQSWNWSSGPMGNFYQTFYFIEPIRQ